MLIEFTLRIGDAEYRGTDEVKTVDTMWELALLLSACIFLLKYEARSSEKHKDGREGFGPLLGGKSV